MIVVVGTLALRLEDGTSGPGDAAGRAAAIAREAAAAGAEVQIVGAVGDDPAGDAFVVALGRASVGHTALRRDPAHPTPLAAPPIPAETLLAEGEMEDDAAPGAPAGGATAGLLPADPSARPRLEAADLELAFRYLTRSSVVVVAEPLEDALVGAVAEAASWAGATLIAVSEPGAVVPPAFETAIALEAPAEDPDDDFARLVGRLAAGLETGRAPAEAFRAALAEAGWERTPAG